MAITVMRTGSSFVAEELKPAWVMNSLGSTTRNSFAFPELIHGMSFPQKDGSPREGVPPDVLSDMDDFPPKDTLFSLRIHLACEGMGGPRSAED